MYVQGFMTRSDSDAAWLRWTQAHPRAWGGDVFGFGWGTGGEGDRFGRKWLPVASVGAVCAGAVAPVSTTITAALVGDVLTNATRLYRHWRLERWLWLHWLLRLRGLYLARHISGPRR